MISTYICAAYLLLFAACAAGAFSMNYNANLLQRVALSILAFWSVWRIDLIWDHGWGYPHEPVLATALMLYAIGSFVKTLHWRWKK